MSQPYIPDRRQRTLLLDRGNAPGSPMHVRSAVVTSVGLYDVTVLPHSPADAPTPSPVTLELTETYPRRTDSDRTYTLLPLDVELTDAGATLGLTPEAPVSLHADTTDTEAQQWMGGVTDPRILHTGQDTEPATTKTSPQPQPQDEDGQKQEQEPEPVATPKNPDTPQATPRPLDPEANLPQQQPAPQPKKPRVTRTQKATPKRPTQTGPKAAQNTDTKTTPPHEQTQARPKKPKTSPTETPRKPQGATPVTEPSVQTDTAPEPARHEKPQAQTGKQASSKPRRKTATPESSDLHPKDTSIDPVSQEQPTTKPHPDKTSEPKTRTPTVESEPTPDTNPEPATAGTEQEADPAYREGLLLTWYTTIPGNAKRVEVVSATLGPIPTRALAAPHAAAKAGFPDPVTLSLTIEHPTLHEADRHLALLPLDANRNQVKDALGINRKCSLILYSTTPDDVVATTWAREQMDDQAKRLARRTR